MVVNLVKVVYTEAQHSVSHSLVSFYCRLTAELKKCKEESLSLEGINDAMKQELNGLRQQYYQKQLRKQREQREQQRQQQLEKHKQQQSKEEQRKARNETQTRQKPSQSRTGAAINSNSHDSRERSVYFKQHKPAKGVQRPLFERRK